MTDGFAYPTRTTNAHTFTAVIQPDRAKLEGRRFDTRGWMEYATAVALLAGLAVAISKGKATHSGSNAR